MEQYKIGYFVGSLSETSINRRLAGTLVELAPASLEFAEIVWKDFPVYNRDFDKDFPKNYPSAYARGKEQIRDSDALLVVTPEYNRGVPGPLKNVFDALSRPYGDSPFTGKPVAAAGASVGSIGTAVAQSHWRDTFGFLNMLQMGEPEAYIKLQEDPRAGGAVIEDEGTRAFLKGFIDAYAVFVKGCLGR